MRAIQTITSKKIQHPYPINFTRIDMTMLPIIIPETDIFPFNDPKFYQPLHWPYYKQYYCPWRKPWRPLSCHYYCRNDYCVFVE